jgi:uncharacterized membrane protein YhaH (DUF805 family)
MFKNIFSFKGRITQKEYTITFGAFMALGFFLRNVTKGADFTIVLLFLLPFIWINVAQTTKRCHDVGLSGWYQLIPFFGLWLLAQKDDFYENKYGPSPAEELETEENEEKSPEENQ